MLYQMKRTLKMFKDFKLKLFGKILITISEMVLMRTMGRSKHLFMEFTFSIRLVERMVANMH